MEETTIASDNVSQATTATNAPVQTEAPRQTLVDTPTDESNNTPTNEFQIPDAYKEKGWAKNIKSTDDLWKNYDNAQQLIGKKTIGIPDDNSTPEQLEEYYSKVRPKEASEYEFPEGTLEENKQFYSELMHKYGISKAQAKGLALDMFNMEKEAFSEKGMMEELKNSFGENDFNNIAKEASKVLSLNLSADDKALLESVPNKYLALMYRFANNVKQSYGATEGTAVINNAGSMAMTKEQKQAKVTELHGKINALNSVPHSASEKQALVNEYSKLINEIYGDK